MLRTVLASLAGILAGGLVVGVVETAGHMIFPPPAGVDVSNTESLAALMSQIPVGAKLLVVLAWALGSLAAGWVAAKISRGAPLLPALIAGAGLLAGGAYTLFTIPHPLWMMAAGLLLPLPMAWLGSKAHG
ncbi:MAG: hypothetical protein SFV51_28380 [Bryobacteraceae bacterium]|nr:hypothetical protein [Bryobacteraceae bacterium]